MTTIKIMSREEVSAMIPTIRSTAVKLTEDIHQCAVSVLDHAREFGDSRGIAHLLNALPNSQRKQALAEWFRAFSGKGLLIKFKDSSFSVETRKDRAADGSDFDIAGAMAVTFADFTKEAEPKPLTLAKLLAMVEKVANDTTTLKNGARKVPHEVAAVAAGMIAAVRASNAA